MMLGVGLTLALPAIRRNSAPSLAAFSGFATSASGSPTLPTHAIGNLIIGMMLRTGGTASAPSDANWTLWDAGTSVGNAWSVYWKIAASTSELWGTWSQTGRRNVYVFSNAQLGFLSGFTGTGTTCTWPALNSGSSLGGESFVAAALFTSTAQTSLVGKTPAALTTNRFTPATTAIVSDGDTATFSTWAAPTPATLDTSANHCGVTFSVRGA